LYTAAPGISPPEEHAAHKAGCRATALAGFDVLRRGDSALDAVETAIVCMEDDPAFDAGVGSHLNRDGVIQLDAGMMDVHTNQVGAVAIGRAANIAAGTSYWGRQSGNERGHE
jgi:beta-aspartyl-peptidase (threonine type)